MYYISYVGIVNIIQGLLGRVLTYTLKNISFYKMKKCKIFIKKKYINKIFIRAYINSYTYVVHFLYIFNEKFNQ